MVLKNVSSYTLFRTFIQKRCSLIVPMTVQSVTFLVYFCGVFFFAYSSIVLNGSVKRENHRFGNMAQRCKSQMIILRRFAPYWNSHLLVPDTIYISPQLKSVCRISLLSIRSLSLPKCSFLIQFTEQLKLVTFTRVSMAVLLSGLFRILIAWIG